MTESEALQELRRRGRGIGPDRPRQRRGRDALRRCRLRLSDRRRGADLWSAVGLGGPPELRADRGGGPRRGGGTRALRQAAHRSAHRAALDRGRQSPGAGADAALRGGGATARQAPGRLDRHRSHPHRRCRDPALPARGLTGLAGAARAGRAQRSRGQADARGLARADPAGRVRRRPAVCRRPLERDAALRAQPDSRPRSCRCSRRSAPSSSETR